MQSYLLMAAVLRTLMPLHMPTPLFSRMVEKWTNACSCTVSCNCCPGTRGTIDLGLACCCYVPEAPAGLQGRQSRLGDIINEWKIETEKGKLTGYCFLDHSLKRLRGLWSTLGASVGHSPTVCTAMRAFLGVPQTGCLSNCQDDGKTTKSSSSRHVALVQSPHACLHLPTMRFAT